VKQVASSTIHTSKVLGTGASQEAHQEFAAGLLTEQPWLVRDKDFVVARRAVSEQIRNFLD